MSVKIFDTMTTATPNFPLAYAEKINVKLQDGTEDNLQNLFDNGELIGGGGDSSVTLTQQEYEALSEEQKLGGLYYTYDTKRIYKNGVQYGASDAEGIGYNNAESGIQATTVQGAIDKVVKTVEDTYAKTTDIPTTLPANGGNADTVNNHTVKSDVPENAVFTDTVYDDTDIKAEIAKKADKEELNKLKNSGIADEILINNSIGRNMSWSELENAKTVTYFTNWDDSTHFPNLYGSGVLIPGLDVSNKYIIYIDNNNTEYINVKTVNGWSTWKELATMDKVNDLGSYINGVKLTPTTDGNLENQVDIGTIKLPKGKWIIFASGWNPTDAYGSETIIGLKGSVDFIRQYKTVMFNFSAFRNVTTETTYTLLYSQGSGTSKNVATNYNFYAVKVGF